MENTTTTNNVNNNFTTTNTNAVEITPAQLEIAKLQSELDSTNQLLVQHYTNEIRLTDSFTMILKEAIEHLSARRIADIVCSLKGTKLREIITEITMFNDVAVFEGVSASIYADKFKAPIDNLNDYISEEYNEADIAMLIDEKYNWHTLLKYARNNNSIDDSDLIEHIYHVNDVVEQELSNGNVSFDDVMQHFDSGDCFTYLEDAGDLTWSRVKDYVDVEFANDVIEDTTLDSDTITNYLSNLSEQELGAIIKNI